MGNKLIGLAPMAGYTNFPMRKICKMFGADFVFSEMISAEGIIRGDITTYKTAPKEKCRIQLFGNDPSTVQKAIEQLRTVPETIDLNAGCPAKKVVKKDQGSALLKDIYLLKEILFAMKEVSPVPISVKVRLGYFENEIFSIVEELVKTPVSDIYIHGRTKVQAYSGDADWNSIFSVAEEFKDSGKSFFGSGDLYTPDIINEKMRNKYLKGVIVARGAIGNPFIFLQSKRILENKKNIEIDNISKINVFLLFLKMMMEEFGERSGIIESRKYFSGYSKGMPCSSKIRNAYMRLTTYNEIQLMLKKYSDELKRINDPISLNPD
jgi:nifR3 family TIM-barrel protein